MIVNLDVKDGFITVTTLNALQEIRLMVHDAQVMAWIDLTLQEASRLITTLQQAQRDLIK